jgi:hypothetical protein
VKKFHNINLIVSAIGMPVWILMSLGVIHASLIFVISYIGISMFLLKMYIKDYDLSWSEDLKGEFLYLKYIVQVSSFIQLILLITFSMVFWQYYIVYILLSILIFQQDNPEQWKLIIENSKVPDSKKCNKEKTNKE